ncbi:uncharacterized protein LOC128867500 [Anastrepha ludens]|uniref:uncharacterized protein LOC128867500 n=1 Tax=Anastrepha ludens TaxID=28586 RepID=UPI0023AF968D|nr:uncharacterized protein LOC128867500 [Anastrepha ludens]
MFLKAQNIFQRVINYIKWLFMLYELNTQISICEPWERVFAHILLLLGATIVIFIVSYVPAVTRTLVAFALYGNWLQDSPQNSLLVERIS